MMQAIVIFIISGLACMPLNAQRKTDPDLDYNLKKLIPVKALPMPPAPTNPLVIAPANAFTHIKDLSPVTLIKYVDPLPQVLKQAIAVWRQQFYNQNKFDILQELNKVSSFKSDYTEKMNLLKKYNLNPQESGGNFIFKLPGTNFLIKIAGTSNKRFNYASNDWATINKVNNTIGKGFDELNKLKQGTPEYKKKYDEVLKTWNDFWAELYEAYKKNPIPFYQGVSRAERHMLIQKAIDFHNIQNVKLPKLYLVPFNDKITSPATDENYFVLEEAPDKDTVIITKDNFRDIPPDAIQDLLKVSKEGYLWDLPFDNKVGLRNDKKTLMLYDLEQPNRFSTISAFLKDRKNYELFALQGIATTVQALKDFGTKAQLDAALEFIKADDVLRTEPQLQDFWGYKEYDIENKIKKADSQNTK